MDSNIYGYVKKIKIFYVYCMVNKDFSYFQKKNLHFK